MDEHDRLVLRVAVTRIVVIALAAGVLVAVPLGIFLGWDATTVWFGLAAAAFGATFTAVSVRSRLPSRWSVGRQFARDFGDQEAQGRLRRAIRRLDTTALTFADMRVAERFAGAQEDMSIIMGIQSGSIVAAIGANQVAVLVGSPRSSWFSATLVAVLGGLLIGNVVTTMWQVRRNRRFVALVRSRTPDVLQSEA